MLIDRICADFALRTPVQQEMAKHLAGSSGEVHIYSPNGELEARWDRWASTDAGISFRYDTRDEKLTIRGSPGLVCGNGDAVMGENESFALDVDASLHQLVGHVLYDGLNLDLTMPTEHWRVTTIDVTRNYFAGDERTARDILLNLSGQWFGHQTKNVEKHTTYWGGRGSLVRLKIYAKGQRLRSKDRTIGAYSKRKLALADSLLRFEAMVTRHWLARNGVPSADHLRWLHEEKFRPMRHAARESEAYTDVERRIRASYPDSRTQTTLLTFWQLAVAYGAALTKHRMGEATFYRNRKKLRDIGIDIDGEIGREITPRQARVLVPVDTWEELEAVATAWENGTLQPGPSGDAGPN